MRVVLFLELHYSALMDADSLHTEAFTNPEFSGLRGHPWTLGKQRVSCPPI